ncbi:hypothetical protein GQ600_4268 [Phytophthora cactorum]|nr:hypothetical protein GQ600_4268 [Phytophthora cactorum]
MFTLSAINVSETNVCLTLEVLYEAIIRCLIQSKELKVARPCDSRLVKSIWWPARRGCDRELPYLLQLLIRRNGAADDQFLP